MIRIISSTVAVLALLPLAALARIPVPGPFTAIQAAGSPPIAERTLEETKAWLERTLVEIGEQRFDLSTSDKHRMLSETYDRVELTDRTLTIETTEVMTT